MRGTVLIVSARTRIPLEFLEVILLDLKSRGLLNSKKGKAADTTEPAPSTVGHRFASFG